MVKKKKIVVFAANDCIKEKEELYYGMAYRMGKLLAENGFITVTGGGPGLMNETMKGAAEAKGETIGVRLEIAGRLHSAYAARTYLFKDLQKRLSKLISLGDGFIALPGGIGTLNEIMAVLALKRKGEISRNIPLILIGDIYRSFPQFFEYFIKDGLLGKDIGTYYSLVKTPEDAVETLKDNRI